MKARRNGRGTSGVLDARSVLSATGGATSGTTTERPSRQQSGMLERAKVGGVSPVVDHMGVTPEKCHCSLATKPVPTVNVSYATTICCFSFLLRNEEHKSVDLACLCRIWPFELRHTRTTKAAAQYAKFYLGRAVLSHEKEVHQGLQDELIVPVLEDFLQHRRRRTH